MATSEEGFRSLTAVAFEGLRNDILGGELRPRERLRIQQLCARYDVGATAIREALSRLVTDGLVESEDQKGFCVASVSKEELLDLTQTRIRLEQSALRMAFERGGLDWEAAVVGAFHRLSRIDKGQGSPESAKMTWRAAHRQFHFALIEGCGSAWTTRLCSVLYDQTERYRSLSGKTSEASTRDVLSEHRQLLDAVLEKDADRACTLIANHFQSTTDIILSAGAVGQIKTATAAARRRPAGPVKPL